MLPNAVNSLTCQSALVPQIGIQFQAAETHSGDGLRECLLLGEERKSWLRRPTSESVKGFGCRPIATIRLAPGPSSESLQ